MESLQYNTTLAKTEAITGSSTEKSYEEFGLESLKSRRWYRRMSILCKVFKSESPLYLFKTIPDAQLGGRGVGLPCLFLKIEKKCAEFPKKSPDVFPWVKFSIQNVLRGSMRKISEVFPCGAFFFFYF